MDVRKIGKTGRDYQWNQSIRQVSFLRNEVTQTIAKGGGKEKKEIEGTEGSLRGGKKERSHAVSHMHRGPHAESPSNRPGEGREADSIEYQIGASFHCVHQTHVRPHVDSCWNGIVRTKRKKGSLPAQTEGRQPKEKDEQERETTFLHVFLGFHHFPTPLCETRTQKERGIQRDE